MSHVEITSMSTKGQVVIPAAIGTQIRLNSSYNFNMEYQLTYAQLPFPLPSGIPTRESFSVGISWNTSK